MRIRESYSWQAGDYAFLWRYQLAMGVLILLLGLAVLIFPEILVALVSAAILMAGAGLIGSAWRLRRLQRHVREMSVMESFEW
jgi:uncharacterized membrane protein HdeD (DUF308 family)